MPYPNTIHLQVKVNGIDITSNVWLVDPGSELQIESVLTRQIDRCTFFVGNYGALTSFKEWDEVIITDLNTSVRLFAGFILQIDKQPNRRGNRVDAHVTAGDYASLFDHVSVKQQYLTTQTDAFILNDIFTRYLPEIDSTTFVQVQLSYPRIRFNRMTLRQVVDQLADSAGGDWYVDYNKKLHYFSLETDLAPFGLSDTPDMSTTFPYESIDKNDDGTGVINRVEVVGGNYLSDDVTIFVAGTGQDNRVILPFSMSGPSAGGPLQVWRNDGTVLSPVWTPMTVLVGYIDQLSSATDVLTYFQEKVLEQTVAWPNLSNAVKIFGRYNIPLLTRYSDNVSFSFYGRYFDAVITDSSIIDKTTARQRAQGLMANASLGSVALSMKIRQPGLHSGMTIHVTNASLSLSDDFFIQRVVASVAQGGYATFDLNLGIYRPEFLDLLISIARNSKTVPEWRDDEVLEELLQQSETLALAEAATLTPDTNHAYKWGADAHALKWSFGTWS